MKRVTTRTETDSFGTVQVPAQALWGAQTQRSLHHFAIGQQPMPLPLIHAMGRVKQAAALTNAALGVLDPAVAGAIAEAAAQVAAGEHDAQFPLSMWQTGSGTQSHMNVNEVVANLASQALGGGLGAERSVHPNDDVNRGQSSNDVFPTAMHLALADRLAPLHAALSRLRGALQAQAEAGKAIIKVGRTHLQDAMPVTLGQEFVAYDAQLAMAERGLERAEPGLYALAIGGTAVGNGSNTHPEFGARVVQALAAQTGLPLTVAVDRLAATAGHEAVVAWHGALRLLAVVLTKLANDLRLMGSGPRAGLGEIDLPANEPGSSMMPGKVNPTQIEALLMVCQQVMGHDVALGIAASQGQFELNTCKPLIAFNALDSQALLTGAMNSLSEHCVEDLRPNTAHMAEQLGRSLMLVSALAPHIGHEVVARIVTHARTMDVGLREAAVAVGGVTAAEFERWVNPRAMLGPSADLSARPLHARRFEPATAGPRG